MMVIVMVSAERHWKCNGDYYGDGDNNDNEDDEANNDKYRDINFRILCVYAWVSVAEPKDINVFRMINLPSNLHPVQNVCKQAIF